MWSCFSKFNDIDVSPCISFGLGFDFYVTPSSGGFLSHYHSSALRRRRSQGASVKGSLLIICQLHVDFVLPPFVTSLRASIEKLVEFLS